jgi:transcriptional regulator with XRE-family HTH domain
VRFRTKAYGEPVNVRDVTVMTTQETTDRVGERIKARRLILKKSQREIAGLTGISHTTLGRIESGEISASNRFLLANLAQALRCPVDQLTGVVVPGGKDGTETHAAAYETIRALLDADLEFPVTGGDAGPFAAMVERTTEAIGYRQACDYARLTRMLPTLIRDLHTATGGEHRDEALRCLIRLAEAASFAVRYTGQPAAATVASDFARQAAIELGDPVMSAFGEWARAHSALGCGLHERAVLLTNKAISALDRAPYGDGQHEMLGMLHLTNAFALVGAGRMADSVAPLAEAETLARLTGETTTLALMFGPTNCRLWELAIVTDGGDPVDALQIGGEVNVQLVPSTSRQATFYIDMSRAAVRTGEDDRAVKLMETAERLAPQRVHGDPLVVDLVRGMLDTARRRAAGPRLRGLAERMRVAA